MTAVPPNIWWQDASPTCTGCGRETGDYKTNLFKLRLPTYSVWINYYCIYNRPFLRRSLYTACIRDDTVRMRMVTVGMRLLHGMLTFTKESYPSHVHVSICCEHEACKRSYWKHTSVRSLCSSTLQTTREDWKLYLSWI